MSDNAVSNSNGSGSAHIKDVKAIKDMPAADTLTPADRYQDLLVDVQMQQVYPDGKIFTDCSPKREPEAILSDYRKLRSRSDFDLKAFVHANFKPQHPDPHDYVSPEGRSLPDHIDKLWDVLSRKSGEHPPSSSLLPLPKPYVIPGGRFCELYYWDTSFTIIGLAASERYDLMHAMADNFAYLIETYGHIPNGNRSYYLGHSQPPLFAYIVELFEKHEIRRAEHYLPMLYKEHDYWMSGVRHLQAGEQHGPLVRLDDGSLLNRYWDARDTPREASYREDIITARGSDRPDHEAFRDTRAGAASGWDFSSRWLDDDDPQNLSTIRTTKILPVDINCFMHKLETVVADLSERDGDSFTSREFRGYADARKRAINKYFWNDERQTYLDYDWQKKAPRERLNVAIATPLFCNLASKEQARAVAATIRDKFLDKGGLATTLINSGQQWDQPNGWAPLQWIAIIGLKNYGEDALADDIADRWLTTVATVFKKSKKLVEKYNLQSGDAGSGGEYAVQDGFGWTNGVTRCLLKMYPDHPANQARAGG